MTNIMRMTTTKPMTMTYLSQVYTGMPVDLALNTNN